MEKLLEIAQGVSDEAEVFYHEYDASSLSIRNDDLREMDGTIQVGYALRIIKGGKMGTAYTKNLLDREEFVKNALASLRGNMDAAYHFPEPAKIPKVDQYDKRVESLTYTDLYDKCEEITSFFKGKVKGQMDCAAGFVRERHRVLNSHGLDYSHKETNVVIVPQLLYPNTETSIYNYYTFKGLKLPKQEELQRLLDVYNASLPEVGTESGKARVMFLDSSMYVLLWRLSTGTNGKNVFANTSPLIDRIGDDVLGENITIYNDPLDTKLLGAIAFDDEGVPTRKVEFFSKGVLKSYHVDLDYAQKLHTEPTGTGQRGAGMFGGDPITSLPESSPQNMRIGLGDQSYEELVASMKQGVVVSGTLGAHSGNIMNGDFSVGLSPGFVIKDGEIAGRVKDGMVSGNVYEMFKKVAGIEKRIHNPESAFKYPCMLFEDVNVAAK
jgi:PmbA protein